VGQKVVLVTGSCGLIGSEVSLFFFQLGFKVVGIDNNLRAVFFGPEGDTTWVLGRLREKIAGYDTARSTSGTVKHCSRSSRR